MSIILNKAQAEADYSAMCALNNVGMRLDAQCDEVRVYEDARGKVHINAYDSEHHANQSAFATAYGLQQE